MEIPRGSPSRTSPPIGPSFRRRSSSPGSATWTSGLSTCNFLERTQDVRRSIALELSRERWPEWARLAGDLHGSDICWTIGAALVERGIGRPDRGRLNKAGDKYEYDVFHTRSSAFRIDEYRGNLADLLAGDGYSDMAEWIRP